jgi:asparagine synthase (glutamine-hydrolysing)
MPRSYLSPDSYAIGYDYLNYFDAVQPDRDQLTRMIYNEFRLRLPELLLMRVDKITMASSIEARVPFLDHALVELTMDIPMPVKLRGGEAKYILKKAVEDLIPKEIINRNKMGFAAPMAQWLEGEFGKQAESEILSSELLDLVGFNKEPIAAMIRDHRAGRRDTSLLIWVLYNLTSWHSRWVS